MLLSMAARSIPKTAPRRCRVLYVDDDAGSLALVEELIASRKDLVLLPAADLELAMKVARRERPEVILVNVDLAALGGIPLMEMLRADPATQATPVLALGADAAPNAAVKSLEAGFFLYLAKPPQAGPLLEALDYALEFGALERAEQSLKESP
jgi:CheY-like chemotaxis protein